MAPSQPDGQPAPADGLLPAQAATGSLGRDFGVYIHIPYCRVRCGYCDFNTYQPSDEPGVSLQDYPALAEAEIVFAHSVLQKSGVPQRPVSTVFFGGGTPTLLPPAALAGLLQRVRDTWGLDMDAEVTVEANPDSVGPRELSELQQAGVTRVSLGVQSTTPHVLATLDRTHDPDRVPGVVEAVKAAGLHVSVDLIYGTPGEGAAEWSETLNHALSWEPDHISAYSLIVEPGTALARRVSRGELPDIDEDQHAAFYQLADTQLSAAGYEWYEISNWSRGERFQSRHNMSYWRGADWWGIGPGAHSHVGGVRWWNVKHPRAYSERLNSGVSPAHQREVLDEATRRSERIMLEIRTRQGLPLDDFPEVSRVVSQWAERGVIDAAMLERGVLVLTREGRLLADGLALELIDW